MAANTAYRVCMKVGLKNPCEPKKLITPDKGKFTPEDLLPSTDLTDSDRKLLMNKAIYSDSYFKAYNASHEHLQ